MSRFSEPVLVEQQRFDAICRMVLHAPEIARAARPGQYLLLRAAPQGSDDPFLRRALWIAGVEPGGRVELLFQADERGTQWLASLASGETVDCFGPLGTPFTLDGRTRNLLLMGTGPGLAALVFLARAVLAVGGEVVLVTLGTAKALPPFLLPPEVEYQTLAQLRHPPEPDAAYDLVAAVRWADQLCAALPIAETTELEKTVRAGRLRWQRGFAEVLLAAPLPCGTGACLTCLVETRDGMRTRCKDGPVFDLRTLRSGVAGG
jgi:dihydroorotate dehydrogenase electron transfer subunit